MDKVLDASPDKRAFCECRVKLQKGVLKMRLARARVQNYRSVDDSGYFDIETLKTILVGPNEAGKTALLQALQKLSHSDSAKFDPLRDYPRGKYNDITTGKVNPSEVLVVEGHYTLEPSEKSEVPSAFADATYIYMKHLDNKTYHRIEGGPEPLLYSAIANEMRRFVAHIDGRLSSGAVTDPSQSYAKLKEFIKEFGDSTSFNGEKAVNFSAMLDSVFALVEEGNEVEEKRPEKVKALLKVEIDRAIALKMFDTKLPTIILFSNIVRVKPLIHLQHLADRVDSKILDDKYYDYGNLCLLKLLGFTARDLSNLGRAGEPPANNPQALQAYRDQLDKRSYQLNSASVRLTNEIRKVWNPNPERPEADKLRVVADGQYLKVVVEDDLGVEIELDQRSEGFQWLVSFFVVFFAEAEDKHENAILLLDEPGLSLHGLKQREFQGTISRLAEKNQTIFSTHSPFLVGANELDLVRVVEMKTRKEGTKVHTTVTAGDSAALLPLQEALGYDLAATLFVHQRNLVLEGLTDYWYLQAISELLSEDGLPGLDSSIALLPASSASKVVYFATILHSNHLKVAALLDSDAAGDLVANQDTLVSALGNKNILRTKDVYSGAVIKVEIEDLFRVSLVAVANSELGWDVSATASSQPTRPIVDIFTAEVTGFSKYKLAKGFLRWTQQVKSGALMAEEIVAAKKLIEKINRVLK